MAESMSREEINRHIEILDRSRDTERVAASVIALAASEDSDAIGILARAFRAEFLERHDVNPSFTNLASAFRTLAAHPTDAVSHLCAQFMERRNSGAFRHALTCSSEHWQPCVRRRPRAKKFREHQ